MSAKKLSLRWNHSKEISNRAFEIFRANAIFTDITWACEDLIFNILPIGSMLKIKVIFFSEQHDHC